VSAGPPNSLLRRNPYRSNAAVFDADLPQTGSLVLEKIIVPRLKANGIAHVTAWRRWWRSPETRLRTAGPGRLNGQDGDREQPGVGCHGAPMRPFANGMHFGHLHDRKQRYEPASDGRMHRHAITGSKGIARPYRQGGGRRPRRRCFNLDPRLDRRRGAVSGCQRGGLSAERLPEFIAECRISSGIFIGLFMVVPSDGPAHDHVRRDGWV